MIQGTDRQNGNVQKQRCPTVPYIVIRDGAAKLYNLTTIKEIVTKVKRYITNKPKTTCKFYGSNARAPETMPRSTNSKLTITKR